MEIHKEGSESGERDPLTQQVIGCAMEVHRHLGPGLLESTYEQCMARELTLAGLTFKLQAPMPVEYKNSKLDCGYRLDLFVEDRLVVELKAVEQLLRIHEAQVITYMKLAHAPVGLPINFNVRLLEDGVRRLCSPPSPLSLPSL